MDHKNRCFGKRIPLSGRIRGTIGTIRALTVLCAVFLILSVSAPILALNVPFDDPRWRWNDRDSVGGTSWGLVGDQLEINANGRDVWRYIAYHT